MQAAAAAEQVLPVLRVVLMPAPELLKPEGSEPAVQQMCDQVHTAARNLSMESDELEEDIELSWDCYLNAVQQAGRTPPPGQAVDPALARSQPGGLLWHLLRREAHLCHMVQVGTGACVLAPLGASGSTCTDVLVPLPDFAAPAHLLCTHSICSTWPIC